MPLAMSMLISSVIPNAAQTQLFQLGFLLITVTLVTALFQIVQNIAVLRLQDKWGAPLQAALWQRLLNLPVSFFRSYTAGDLGMRVMGINAIQQTLSGTVVGSLLAGIISLISFGLLFYFDARLALIAGALVLVAVGATLLAGLLQVRYQRQMVELEGRLAGLVLQTITGISKFRVAGAENRAFAAWAADFGRSKQITYRARNVTNNLVVFNAGFSLLTTAAIFSIVSAAGRGTFATGTFLAFNAAFIQLLMAMLALSRAIVSVLNIVPTYERLRPVMLTLPELDDLKTHPGELNGRIEVSHVSFRYSAEKPPVLKDVSLTINPGEFVAIVGTSGSGKSTLLRLLLGFETPETGAIYYDNNDLAGLDIRATRRQIGVVLQNGSVMPGDIFHNIVGTSTLTLDDAWAAATMAGLDKDIRQMPMGMHTVITASGSTLSGGQRQRLLIARAIVNKPRVIFFDEATSALDNTTQSIVAESLDNLQATRIIIAHRLSTIINADRIYVMDKGEIVESGNYTELMAQKGVFAKLAERQII
ncbi:MAG TPA: NHLP bacteriocin export ABC transporter permease/ATPase subunit, partial [Anaerolineae bacterium]|nr:NHLP bacteriocin export ABC transporter permease/ATPase subunit [Anaerolineae bacterium]